MASTEIAVLTAAAAMATVTIEVEKRSPIMTSQFLAVDQCDELFFERLRRCGLDLFYRGSARGKMPVFRGEAVAAVLNVTGHHDGIHTAITLTQSSSGRPNSTPTT